MQPRNVLFWYWIIFAAGLVCFVAGLFIEPAFIAGFIIIAGDLIFYFLCYRCPHCGRFLDRSRGDYCPYCGRELQKKGE